MLLGLASVPAGLADAADCSDRGPWPCAEAGCPSPIVGCDRLGTACGATFDDIWESIPGGFGSQRVWQECPYTCNRCGALWRCAWILKVSAADVVEMGVDAMNSALVQQALEQYAASNASAKPPSSCSTRTNHFFEYQRRVWKEQRKKAQAPTAAYSSLQQLFAQSATRWVEAARGSTGGADAATLFQYADDVFAWSSLLTADDCHPEHDHISSGGKSVADSDKPVVLSAVYYASGQGQTHAPLIFRDPHNGTGHDDESFSRCSYLEPSPIAAPRGSTPWSPPNETRRLALNPEPGALYIWPGWMPHGVPQWPPHESDSSEQCDQDGTASSPRVAFAANIELAKDSLQQVPPSDGVKKRREDIVKHLRLPPVLVAPKFTFTAPSMGE
jgi:hypothetical protein